MDASKIEKSLTAEAVEGTALALQGIDDIEGSDGLTLGVLGVGDGVTDDRLEEGLENTAGLFVDHGRNTLDTTTTSKTTDGRFGYALDIIAKNLSVTLRTALAKALATFTTSSHDELVEKVVICDGFDVEKCGLWS